MKILLLHQYFLLKDDPGGSRFNEMTQLWAAKGNQITVITGMVNYATGKKHISHKGKYIVVEEYAENIKVLRCHVSESYNASFIGRLWAYFSFVISSFIASNFYLRGKFDVMIVTSPPLFIGITGYLVSKMRKIPLIFEVRDLWPESAIETGVLTNKFLIKYAYWFERFIYSKSIRINTLSPAFFNTLKNEKNIPEVKLWMIPNASDFSSTDLLLKTFNAQDFREELFWKEKFVFIYIGAHGVANNLIQVIDAAEKLQNRNAHFVFIGAGMDKSNLIQTARERKLSNVEFINAVPKNEVYKYILASDVGISVLKRIDVFKTIYSNKTFDYMACKKPVLMLIDGVSRELVEKARAGLYAEPENIADIVVKMNVLIDSPETCAQMGENGYKYAKVNFDRETLAEKYIKNIEEVII